MRRSPTVSLGRKTFPGGEDFRRFHFARGRVTVLSKRGRVTIEFASNDGKKARREILEMHLTDRKGGRELDAGRGVISRALSLPLVLSCLC